MTHVTTIEIQKYSTDTRQSNALLALMDYYRKDSLSKISEEQALAFLAKLQNKEIEL